MTHCGIGRNLSERRMDPSEGVAEPHREFWLLTQRTDVGTALPPRYRAESSAAWLARAESVAGPRPPLDFRSPWTFSLSSIRRTHSASWARLKCAGMATTAVPFSQNAAT